MIKHIRIRLLGHETAPLATDKFVQPIDKSLATKPTTKGAMHD